MYPDNDDDGNAGMIGLAIFNLLVVYIFWFIVVCKLDNLASRLIDKL